MILQMKTGDHVIYVWHDKALRRQLFTGKESSETSFAVDGRSVDVEFAGPDAKLIRLRLHTLRNGKRADGETIEIAAALGGDWR